jgi:Big-like domain-containing protein
MKKLDSRKVSESKPRSGFRSFLACVTPISCGSPILLLMLILVAGTGRIQAQTPPPQIFFTDLDSGPNSGGENVSGFSGAYVTLYGDFLGASQGGSAVTWNGLNCLRVVGPSGSYTGWGSSHFWYQEIVVQLGSACTPGAGSFVVTVNGAASNALPFTVRSTGKIYAVSTSGNDSNAGSFAAPFGTVIHCKDVLTPGDTCYVENGVAANTVDNFDAALALQGSGTAGNPIAIAAYPGATVTVGLSATNSEYYGLRVPYIGVTSSYVTIAGLQFTPTQQAMDAAGNPGPPVTLSTNWRVIANLFSCPDANGQAGCFNSHELSYLQFLGNEATGTSSSLNSPANKEQHAVYFSSDTNHVVAAWNEIHDNNSCRAIQFFSSPLGGGGASDPTGASQYDLSVHDNLIYDDPCDGVNFATVDPSQGKVEAYNNLIYHVGTGPDQQGGDSGDFSCFYVAAETNTGKTAGTGTIEFYNNTLYDCGYWAANYPNNGVFMINSGEPGLLVRIRNNIMYQIGASSESASHNGNSAEPFGNAPTVDGGAWISATVSGSNNILFSIAGAALPSFLSNTVNSDPLFLDLSTPNFHLQSTSPAIGAGIAITSGDTYDNYAPWNGNPPTDLDGIVRPSPPSIGAYEFSSGGSSTSPTGTTTTLTVSATAISSGQSETFTATVTPASGTVTPAGTVTFTDGATALGTTGLNGSGVATLTTTALTASGSHSITAGYSGNSNFTASTSAPVAVSVSAASPPNFQITLSPASGSASAGAPAMATVTITPQNSFSQAVTLSCGGLPSGASCAFSPSSVTPKGMAATSALSISVTSSGSMPLDALPMHGQSVGRGGSVAAISNVALSLANLLALMASGSLLVGYFRGKLPVFCASRARVLCLLVPVCVAGLVLLDGCGSTMSTQPVTPNTQTVTIAVTGTSGTLTNSTSFTLTMPQ